eukprot:CAMPEP_0177693678 /NCGR_PEP_ID=MMETSP0484_2-20121128/2527_1 /TAXON_ID=354590 /ORGANISM="Rhodomonas lens, Strain RHODO" /LENGTH=398 /DNA_ID=CAMNT_0019204503 /DNA_START=53 /DNA_END=1249 /DNA_ORIENTATION=+
MGRLWVAIQAAASIVLLLYLVTRPLFSEWRDGAVERVGQGKVRSWTAPQGAAAHVSRIRINWKASSAGASMYCLQPEEDPRISFLLIHDITEHGGALGDLANRLFDHCGQAGFVCSVFAIDLPGHGHTGMSAESGEFNMTSMVELVWEAADWIRTETKESAVFTIGLGIGGEVAFQASSGSEAITGTISNGLLLSAELKFRDQTELLKGWVGDALELLLHGQRIFLPSLLSFWRMYDRVVCEDHTVVGCEWRHDQISYEEHMGDPLSTWYSSITSLRSLYHYRPLTLAADNTKPILVVTGAKDQAIPLVHVRECFRRLGGKKYLRFDSRAGHQMLRQTLQDETSRVIVGWSLAVLDGSLGDLAVETPSLSVETVAPTRLSAEYQRVEGEGEGAVGPEL